jgi:hypothetical protein
VHVDRWTTVSNCSLTVLSADDFLHLALYFGNRISVYMFALLLCLTFVHPMSADRPAEGLSVGWAGAGALR